MDQVIDFRSNEHERLNDDASLNWLARPRSKEEIFNRYPPTGEITYNDQGFGYSWETTDPADGARINMALGVADQDQTIPHTVIIGRDTGVSTTWAYDLDGAWQERPGSVEITWHQNGQLSRPGWPAYTLLDPDGVPERYRWAWQGQELPAPTVTAHSHDGSDYAISYDFVWSWADSPAIATADAPARVHADVGVIGAIEAEWHYNGDASEYMLHREDAPALIRMRPSGTIETSFYYTEGVLTPPPAPLYGEESEWDRSTTPTIDQFLQYRDIPLDEVEVEAHDETTDSPYFTYTWQDQAGNTTIATTQADSRLIDEVTTRTQDGREITGWGEEINQSRELSYRYILNGEDITSQLDGDLIALHYPESVPVTEQTRPWVSNTAALDWARREDITGALSIIDPTTNRGLRGALLAVAHFHDGELHSTTHPAWVELDPNTQQVDIAKWYTKGDNIRPDGPTDYRAHPDGDPITTWNHPIDVIIAPGRIAPSYHTVPSEVAQLIADGNTAGYTAFLNGETTDVFGEYSDLDRYTTYGITSLAQREHIDGTIEIWRNNGTLAMHANYTQGLLNDTPEHPAFQTFHPTGGIHQSMRAHMGVIGDPLRPAYTEYNPYGIKHCEAWRSPTELVRPQKRIYTIDVGEGVEEGVLHREEGPALTYYYNNGQVSSESFYSHGHLQSRLTGPGEPDLPAETTWAYDQEGNYYLAHQAWYDQGVAYSKIEPDGEWPSRIDNEPNGEREVRFDNLPYTPNHRQHYNGANQLTHVSYQGRSGLAVSYPADSAIIELWHNIDTIEKSMPMPSRKSENPSRLGHDVTFTTNRLRLGNLSEGAAITNAILGGDHEQRADLISHAAATARAENIPLLVPIDLNASGATSMIEEISTRLKNEGFSVAVAYPIEPCQITISNQPAGHTSLAAESERTFDEWSTLDAVSIHPDIDEVYTYRMLEDGSRLEYHAPDFAPSNMLAYQWKNTPLSPSQQAQWDTYAQKVTTQGKEIWGETYDWVQAREATSDHASGQTPQSWDQDRLKDDIVVITDPKYPGVEKPLLDELRSHGAAWATSHTSTIAPGVLRDGERITHGPDVMALRENLTHQPAHTLPDTTINDDKSQRHDTHTHTNEHHYTR